MSWLILAISTWLFIWTFAVTAALLIQVIDCWVRAITFQDRSTRNFSFHKIMWIMWFAIVGIYAAIKVNMW